MRDHPDPPGPHPRPDDPPTTPPGRRRWPGSDSPAEPGEAGSGATARPGAGAGSGAGVPLPDAGLAGGGWRAGASHRDPLPGTGLPGRGPRPAAWPAGDDPGAGLAGGRRGRASRAGARSARGGRVSRAERVGRVRAVEAHSSRSPAAGPIRPAPRSRFRRPTRSDVLLFWAPAALGVCVAMVIVTAVLVTRGSGATPTPRASIDYAWTPPVADYTPAVAVTTRAPAPTLPPNTLPPLSPTPSRTTARPRTTPPPPPPPPVTGRYTVVDRYRDGFIGEVLVSNPSTAQRDWTVRLQFPRGVGRLHTFWVEGAAPPELDRLGGAYVFTGRAPVGAKGKLSLRMQFERWGRDIDPTACTVNGTACTSA